MEKALDNEVKSQENNGAPVNFPALHSAKQRLCDPVEHREVGANTTAVTGSYAFWESQLTSRSNVEKQPYEPQLHRFKQRGFCRHA